MVDKKAKAVKAPKTVITIQSFNKVTKPMPEHTGRGTKYGMILNMDVGECVCFPPGSISVDLNIFKRAVTGAAKRAGMMVVCSTEPEGFCVWCKAKNLPIPVVNRKKK